MLRIKGIEISYCALICLALYYGFAQFLPESSSIVCGKACKKIRQILVRKIFKRCGLNVNIERKAYFGSGRNIEIGDNSGIGVNCNIPSNTIIGDNVMMGPNCYILSANHKFSDTNTPMILQGHVEQKQTRIGNDIWIGRDVLMTPGRIISDGTIVGAGCVLTKDFPEYSIVGGNPATLIRNRKIELNNI